MPHDPFYGSRQWKEARGKYLALHPKCEICALIGIDTWAREVDHKVPVNSGGAPLDPANFSAKCRLHHSQKTMALDRPSVQGRKKLVTTGADGWPVYTEERSNGNVTTFTKKTSR